VRIGIVSDIHSNEQGLRLALDGMGDVDELLCLGDAIFEYKFSNEVVGLLKERKAYVITRKAFCPKPAGAPANAQASIPICSSGSPINRTAARWNSVAARS
jgi:hypothetical protein